MKKTLLTAAAALAVIAGATSVSTTDANAGFNVKIGFHGHKFHGHFYKKHHYGHKKCYVKYYKKIKVKVWTHHGLIWKWIKKPVYGCYYH